MAPLRNIRSEVYQKMYHMICQSPLVLLFIDIRYLFIILPPVLLHHFVEQKDP